MKLLAFDHKAIVIGYQQDPACKNIQQIEVQFL